MLQAFGADGVLFFCVWVCPIASLINVTERRAYGENVASKKMLPEPGNLFELYFYDVF